MCAVLVEHVEATWTMPALQLLAPTSSKCSLRRRCVKRSEITGCLRLYRKGIDAHAKLREKLKAARAAAEGVPLLRQAKKDLEEAEGELARIGDGLSVLPELADEVLLLRQ